MAPPPLREEEVINSSGTSQQQEWDFPPTVDRARKLPLEVVSDLTTSKWSS